MNPLDARLLALQLMATHGLNDWHFAFDHARRRFGCCKYRSKTISLSRPLTLLNTEDQVRDTLLHEIAHALTPGDGHGAKWRAMCLRVGARPKRCYGESEVAAPPRRPAAYRYGCRPCAWWVERRRLVANRYVCGKCGGKLTYEHKATGQSFRVEPGRRGSQLVEEPSSQLQRHIPIV
jgi:predicted SprT family Zn-dependent metalloprotease